MASECRGSDSVHVLSVVSKKPWIFPILQSAVTAHMTLAWWGLKDDREENLGVLVEAISNDHIASRPLNIRESELTSAQLPTQPQMTTDTWMNLAETVKTIH